MSLFRTHLRDQAKAELADSRHYVAGSNNGCGDYQSKSACQSDSAARQDHDHTLTSLFHTAQSRQSSPSFPVLSIERHGQAVRGC